MKKIYLLTISPLLAASCVSYTKIQDEKPLPLKFTSKEAAQTFYEGILLKEQTPITEENDESINFYLRLTSPISWGKVDTPQKKLNAAFRKADHNGSGTVNLAEATSFTKTLKEESS